MSSPPRRPGGPSSGAPGGRPPTRPPGSRPPADRNGGERTVSDRPKRSDAGSRTGAAPGPRPSHSPSRAGGPRPSSPRNADGELRTDKRAYTPRTSVQPARGTDTVRDAKPARDARPSGERPPSRSPAPRPDAPRPRSDRPATERPRTERTRTERTLSVSPARSPERAPERAPAPERAYDERPGPRAQLPETPRGTVWLYGHHAVEAALSNPARRLRRLILTEEAEAALTARHPPPWSLSPERTERSRIDQLLGRDVVHQGAALLADPLPTPLLTKVLERPGVVLVLDQVVDPRNIGAVLRSAAAFGACCVITQDRNAPEETGALAKAASGALEIVPLVRAVNLARTLVALKAAGFWTIGLDAGGRPLSGPALAERRVALVLGAEGAGLRRLVKETCDEVAGLAMPGTMESLNVSAAATVALYEISRTGD